MSNDTVNVQRGIVGAGSDDDTYVLSANLIDANAEITISDVEGANKIQLIGGLTITSSIVAGDTAQLTLSNGAVVTVLGASTMSYEVGGNPLTGTAGVTKDYATFATDVLGTTVPTTGTSTGGESTVNEDGTATGGAGNAYTLTAAAESVDEGATATFNLTTDGTVAEGTVVNYTITGVDAADVDGGVLTGTATIAADGTATITVALLADLTTEGAETLTVTLDGTSVSASSTVNDTSETPTSKSFTLTTGTDTLTPTATDAANQTSASDDIISGEVSALTSANTLNVTDVLDGGDGTDTLNVTLNTAFAGFSTGSVKNIENINLTNGSSIARNFDASGVTGVEKYTIDANDAGVNLSDLATTTAVSLSNLNNTGTFTSTFVSGASELTGTSDAMTFSIDGVGVVDDTSTTANEEKIVTVTLTDIETANVESTGTNVVAFSGTDLKTLNLSGAGTTKVTSVASSTTAFDATSATGAVTADLTATTSTLTTIAGGAGDDNITFDEVDAVGNATLSGGAGADTLTLNSNGGTVQYTATGFETVALNNINTAGLTFSGANSTDITTISSNNSTAQAVAFVNMGSSDLTINALKATSDAGDISTDNTGAVTLNYTADSTSVTAKTAQAKLADYTFSGAAGALTVNVGEYTDTTTSTITAAKASSVVLNVASGKSAASTPVEVTEFDGTITAAEATSITVSADGKLGTSAAISAAKATGATVTNGATAGTLNLTAAKLENLNVTTGAGLDLSASTLSGVQTLTVAANKGHTQLGALAKAANITLSGADSTSQVTMTNLGGAIDYSMTLSATGLKAGMNVGTINVNTGYDITADVSGVTGNVVVSNIGTGTTGRNVTVNATGSAGNVQFGDLTGTGDINVTGSSVGTFQVGNISAGTTGNVTVNLDGTLGAVTTGSFAGKTVNVDLSNTIGGKAGTTYTVTALDSATVAVSSLEASTVGVTAATGSTALAVALTGGIKADAVTITDVATSNSITVTGDLGLDTDSVTITGNTTVARTVDISGLTNYDASNITGGSGVDTITGGAGVDTIAGAAGADILTGGAGNDIFVAGTVTTTATGTITPATPTPNADLETITVTADGTDGGDESIVVNYTLNGTGGTKNVDLTGVDTTDVTAVANAITAAFTGGGAVAGLTVSNALGVVTFTPTTPGSFTLANTTENNWTTGAFTEANGTDAAQVSTLTIGGTVIVGEVYSVTLTPQDGAAATYSFTATTTSTSDVATGLAALVNANAAVGAAAVGSVITITDANADNGGFTLSAAGVAGPTSQPSGVTVAGTAVSGFDTITDFGATTSHTDVLRLIAADNVATASGVAGTTATSNVEVSAGGKVTFAAADDTLAEMVTAIAADDTDVASNEVVFFELGSDTYVYAAGADTTNAANDSLIKLTGVTGLTTLTESGTTAGDFTIA